MNNSKIAMNSRLLESIIIEEDQNEIILEQKVNEDEITNLENYIKQIDFISRPMSNPFEIYIFEIEKKLIKRLKYTKEKVQMFELDKYGENSAFCNGMNHLFISGGIDPITNEELNLFWDIDIENNCLKNKIKMPISKKNHNMIYFNETVYIIGGDDENTIFYDTEKMAFIEWENLNQKKFKPSLIICNSILFCFDSSLKYSSRFNDDNRNVSLEGEAYFEVTHHDNKKFTVKTDNYDVVVKGTKFDVASYQSDPVSMVSLVKGSVELAYEKGVIDMKPGERVVLDKNTGEFTKEKYTDDSRAWIDNRTELDNISLIDLARVLSRQYDVKIHVQSARLANTHFAVSLRNKETIMDVLDALQMIEPMKITRNKRDIYITE